MKASLLLPAMLLIVQASGMNVKNVSLFPFERNESYTVTESVRSCPIILTTGQQELIFEAHLTHATNGEANGSIDVTVISGAAPFLYSINNGPYVSYFTFSNLPWGNYTICVRGSDGCVVCVEYEIQNITSIVEPETAFKFFPNPVSTWLNIESDMPVDMDILDIHGHLILRAQGSGLQQINVGVLLPGLYLIRFRDGHSQTCKRLIVN